MSYEIVLRKEAQIDLDEIFIWYEEQKIGLGLIFISEFERIIHKIAKHPFYASYVATETDVRSASLKKFPYEVIYRINQANNQVRIIAIIHQHRNPEWFRQRLLR